MSQETPGSMALRTSRMPSAWSRTDESYHPPEQSQHAEIAGHKSA